MPTKAKPEPDAPEDLELEDFDAFWVKRKRPRTRIMGQIVELPASLPLRFELEAKKLAKSKAEQDVRTLVAILFGDDALDQWTQAGMDVEQFQLLLAWAPRKIAGQDVTLAQVAEELADYQARLAAKGDSDDEDDADPS